MSRREPLIINDYINQSTLFAEPMKKIQDSIINECTKSLTRLMVEIREKLKENDTLSDYCLEHYILDLANELYFVGNCVEKIGIQEDACKAIRQKAYTENRQSTNGTVADRNNMAEKCVINETMVLCIYNRSYKAVKICMDSGYEMLNSLKKIMNRRISELELSKSKYIGESRNE